jgi:hypothetical protein
MASDPRFGLGIVFIAAGAALVAAVGPAMIGIFALGIVFVAIAAAARGRSGGE